MIKLILVHQWQTVSQISTEFNMKIYEIINETATAGATSSGNIASVVSPNIAIGQARGKKSYIGSPGISGKHAPKPPKVVQPKTKYGTAKNALDMKGNIFGTPIKR